MVSISGIRWSRHSPAAAPYSPPPPAHDQLRWSPSNEIARQDRQGTVCGAAIDDDMLQVRISLRQDTLNGSLNEDALIEGGGYDWDAYKRTHNSIFQNQYELLSEQNDCIVPLDEGEEIASACH